MQQDTDSGQSVIEDIVLAACELWIGSAVNQDKVVKMVKEGFKPDEATRALDKLLAGKHVENVQRHNHGEKYFEDVVKVCASLVAEKKLPKVVVASLDILRIKKPDIDPDNVTVNARMDVMEKKMEGMDKNVSELLKNFKTMFENQTKVNPVGLQVPVNVPGTPAVAVPPRGYAQVAANGVQGGQFRQRINSKRTYQEMNENTRPPNNSVEMPEGDGQGEWNEVNKRKQRKVNYGTAKVTTVRSDEAVAPFEVFIANTHPESTKELIKDILVECAENDSGRSIPLEVLEVKCMTNKERTPNPRTLCWKVTVPHRERDHMMKDDAYPEGWAHRRFFPPRPSVPQLRPTLPAAKQARLDNDITDSAGA